MWADDLEALRSAYECVPDVRGRAKQTSPLIAVVSFVSKAAKAVHSLSMLPYGSWFLAKPPRKSAGISIGNWLLTLVRTTSRTAEVLGAITCSEPETEETRMWSDRRYALKGVPLETPKAVSRRKASTGSVVSKCDGMRRSNSAKTAGPGPR